MKVLGYYRWPWAGCANGNGEVLYTTSPYFGIRRVGLVMRKKDFTLILVRQLGELAWVNVDSYDLIPG